MAEEPTPYRDDPEAIPDDAVLMRRVHPTWVTWSDDESPPGMKSGAFQDTNAQRAAELGYPGPGMSVHRLDVVEQEGHDLEWLLRGHDGFGLARVTAGQLRQHGMGIDPRPETDDPTHAVVFAQGKPKRSGGMQKRTREAASWEILPTR